MVRRQIERRVKTTAGIYKISQPELASITIPLPPLTEQHQIVAEVERRLSIVAGAEAQVDANLRRADRLRQSILKQAFSGQLIPQDPNDEPVSVLLERIRANDSVGAQHAAPRNRTTQPKRAQHVAPLRETETNHTAPDFTSLDAVLAAILAQIQPDKEYSRADLADALGLSTGRWSAAIQELKRRGKVRQTGEKRGARYELVGAQSAGGGYENTKAEK
jgi:type I restriction enzyme S subunit